VSGVTHGYGIQRQSLPFAAPAVVHDSKTGQGNGRIARMTVTRQGQAPVTVLCVVPTSTTAGDLAKRASVNNRAWLSTLKALPRARAIPDAGQRQPLSNEARAFAGSMLASPSSATTNAATRTMNCVLGRGEIGIYDDADGNWAIIDFEVDDCGDDGGDVIWWIIDNGYDQDPYIYIDADKYEITGPDSITFTAHIVSNVHLSPLQWRWAPASGILWDPWTHECGGGYRGRLPSRRFPRRTHWELQ